MSRRRRGQLVLVAAAVATVAFVPVLAAYLQLGYHDDVAASGSFSDPARNAERVLERAVHRAAAGTAGSHDWSASGRQNAVRAVRDLLEPRLASLRSARVARGTAYQIGFNRTAAQAWAENRCPGGPNRPFGDCGAERGVVLQGRAGETHVLAVAFDVTVTTEDGVMEMTVVIRTVE